MYNFNRENTSFKKAFVLALLHGVIPMFIFQGMFGDFGEFFSPANDGYVTEISYGLGFVMFFGFLIMWLTNDA